MCNSEVRASLTYLLGLLRDFSVSSQPVFGSSCQLRRSQVSKYQLLWYLYASFPSFTGLKSLPDRYILLLLNNYLLSN